MEAAIIKQTRQSNPPARTSGKVPPFFISLETESLVLRNCMVDSDATNNIVPPPIMRACGLVDWIAPGIMKRDKVSTHAIDSRKVPAYK